MYPILLANMVSKNSPTTCEYSSMKVEGRHIIAGLCSYIH